MNIRVNNKLNADDILFLVLTQWAVVTHYYVGAD